MLNDNPLVILWWLFGVVAMIYSLLNMFDIFHDLPVLQTKLSIFITRGLLRAERLRFLKGLTIAASGLLALSMTPAAAVPTLSGQVIRFTVVLLGFLVVLGSIDARITRKQEIQYALDNPE